MKYLFLICAFSFSSCLGNLLSSDEILHARRIEALWQEKDLSVLKKHIKEFKEKYPSSQSNSRFSALLGEIAFSEKNFEEALEHYEKIKEENIKKSVQIKKWHAAYMCRRWRDLIFEITPSLLKQSDEAKYYYAGACFHEGFSQSKENNPLWDEALTLFEILENNATFSEKAKLKLAEIHHLLGHHNEATKYYLELADSIEMKDEEALLKAAYSLCDFDHARSKKIASHLARFGLKTRKEGAELWFYLLVKNGEQGEIASNETTLLSSLPPSKKNLCHSYLSKIYFRRKEWGKCVHHFEKSGKNPELTHAFAYIALNENTKAESILDKILLEEPSNQEAQILKAKIFCNEEKWKEAYSIAHTIHTREASQLIIQALLGCIASESGNEYHQLLISEIQKHPVTSPTLKIALARSYIALQENDLALETLFQLEDKESFEVEALLAQVFFAKGETQKGIFHGEKALSLDERHSQTQRLHLHLFNAYLRLARDDLECEYEEMAAHHLHAVIGFEPVSLENQLWLAHHFVKKYGRAFDERDALRAVSILEPLCQDIQPFEREALDLAGLYENLSEPEKSRSLLIKIIEAQEKHPEMGWKFKEKSKLQLADLYQRNGEFEAAYDLYQTLEKVGESQVAYTATLNLARMAFSRLSEEKKCIDDPEIVHLFHELKVIKNKRHLMTEPVHLEAAIDLAEYSAAFVEKDQREKELLSMLMQVKVEFSSEDDLPSKDYHLSLELMPDKGRLYSAYMRYLDAKICHLQSLIAKKEGNLIESRTKEKAAYALFSSLKQGKYAVTPYIKEKAEMAMK